MRITIIARLCHTSLRCIAYVVLITFSVTSCGQQNPTEQLNNVKTDLHIKMPGTNVFLIAPKDFVNKPASNGIMYAEFGANSMKSATINITQFERAFDNKIDPKDSSIYPIRVNQYDGYYKSEKNGDGFYKEALYFGNERVSVSIHAEILTRDTAFVKVVSNAIRTAVLIDEKLPDPADDAIFKVDVKDTKLKFARLLNGMLVYNEAGDLYSKSNFGFIVAFRYALNKPREGQEQKIAEDYLKDEIYYKEIKIKESTPITIDGHQGYAFTADGVHTESNDHNVIYLVMLPADNGTYIMLGTTNVLFEYRLSMFKKVAQTFHLKEK